MSRAAGTVSSRGPSGRTRTRGEASSGSKRETGSSRPRRPSPISANVHAAVSGLVIEAIRKRESRVTGPRPWPRTPKDLTYTSPSCSMSTAMPGTWSSPTWLAAASQTPSILVRVPSVIEPPHRVARPYQGSDAPGQGRGTAVGFAHEVKGEAMVTRKIAPIGDPCWVDHMSNDVDATRRFYTEIFGWEAGEASEEFGGYFQFFRDGVPVGGAMPNMTGQEMPDFWSVYLAVANADDVVARAQEAGATVVAPAMKVG